MLHHLQWPRFHVLGSSWGTIVAQYFALTEPPGLDRIVLSGPAESWSWSQSSRLCARDTADIRARTQDCD